MSRSRGALQGTLQRTYWFEPDISGTSGDTKVDHAKKDRRQVVDTKEANLVSSLLVDGQHAPALDIDLPCELRASTTPGHYHLYIDKPMPWEQYEKLLTVLAEVGIIEEGYRGASIARGQTFLRAPGIHKEWDAESL